MGALGGLFGGGSFLSTLGSILGPIMSMMMQPSAPEAPAAPTPPTAPQAAATPPAPPVASSADVYDTKTVQANEATSQQALDERRRRAANRNNILGQTTEGTSTLAQTLLGE